MKIYMDVCCLNRPFDDQTQDRIRVEADSIIAILERCRSGTWELAGSDMIEDVLLTTDDSFLSTARKLKTKTQAANPVLWFMEATLYGYWGKSGDSIHI